MAAHYVQSLLQIIFLLAFCSALFTWILVSNESWKRPMVEQRLQVLAISSPIHMVITVVMNNASQDAIELCAIYSTAITNPNRTVLVHVRQKLPEAQLFSDLDNIVISFINDSTVCAGTPVEHFYQNFLNNLMPKSQYGVVDLSDILRSCIVYKYGGTYTDTDTIQLKPFDESVGNFVVLESSNVANGLFHFEKGNRYLFSILSKVEAFYDPNKWGSIGLQLYTNVLKNNLTMVAKMNEDFIFPIGGMPNPILDPKKAESSKQLVSKKGSVGIHISRSYLTMGNVAKYSSESYLAKLIEDRCPPIYKEKLFCLKSNSSDCYLPFYATHKFT